jgi:hypothetical protein
LGSPFFLCCVFVHDLRNSLLRNRGGVPLAYVRAQEAPPALTAVVQAALRQYLGERGFLREARSLGITPAKRGSGRRDISQAHDRYLTRK